MLTVEHVSHSNRKFESSMIIVLSELVNNQLNFTLSSNEQKFLQFFCTTEKRLLRGLLYFRALNQKMKFIFNSDKQ